MQNLSFSHRSWCRLVYGYQYFERCYWFDLKKWMGCKYGAVKVGTFMRFLISEDWNICEFIIFMVVPFVNCTCTHPPIYIHTHTRSCTLTCTHARARTHTHARARTHTHTHTHTHMHFMSSDGMLYNTNSFFRWSKSSQKYLNRYPTNVENVEAPNNYSKWQIGFTSAFKGLKWLVVRMATVQKLEFLRRNFPVNSNKYADEVRCWCKNLEYTIKRNFKPVIFLINLAQNKWSLKPLICI